MLTKSENRTNHTRQQTQQFTQYAITTHKHINEDIKMANLQIAFWISNGFQQSVFKTKQPSSCMRTTLIYNTSCFRNASHYKKLHYNSIV